MITVKALTRFVHHDIDAHAGDDVEMSEALARDLAKVGLVEAPAEGKVDKDQPAEKAAPGPANKKAPEPKNKGA
ncbi:hypothetical protein [Cupriavidus sp.]|uniref:hypothetical protein n=1 Tax=Cupriavidus sp. TaxID=1873897 RepID=UPI0025B97A67|nr:hypothetical protein [Cupriavidus sp.]MCA3186678.1 hypothetical protein [Cupriavidus sp.]MCA3194610.1 hypothetical protein [Cupriavidus sp.]MCA3197899.1 hypothetical protein [Cupriavidus sp.]MCA3201970.1 hypothetical protein [Cupriavidus sp.]MCA3209870.1 hypothetical protein [Cupriavidus sp.]